MIVKELNSRITEFINKKENHALKTLTCASTAPFRGGLFCSFEDSLITEYLKTRSADLHWFGSNPCGSIDKIIGNNNYLRDFEYYVQTEKWCEVYKGLDGIDKVVWNPLFKPEKGWVLFHEAIKNSFATMERCSFSNYIPWSSKNISELIGFLDKISSDLSARVINFSEDQAIYILKKLKPKVVVVPFSLDQYLSSGSLLSSKKSNAHKYHFKLRKNNCHYSIGKIESHDINSTVLYIRHPSSLRLSIEDREIFILNLTKIISEIK